MPNILKKDALWEVREASLAWTTANFLYSSQIFLTRANTGVLISRHVTQPHDCDPGAGRAKQVLQELSTKGGRNGD
jgi:hypothetical protein